MTRNKNLKKPVRVSLVLEESYFEHVKRSAINLSVEKQRNITPSEAMRIAIEKIYPLPEVVELLDKNSDKN